MPVLQPSASTLRNLQPTEMTTKKKPSWSSDWVKKQSWNKIPMLMTMTSTPYPLAEKILMRRLLKKVLKILKVLKVPDWDTWKYWRYQIEWHWTCRQLARIVQSSLHSFERWRCPNSYQSTDILDKRLDSYEPFDEPKSAEQPPYHLIGPYNYHVPWFAFWAFAYIKLIPD